LSILVRGDDDEPLRGARQGDVSGPLRFTLQDGVPFDYQRVRNVYQPNQEQLRQKAKLINWEHFQSDVD
jgi:hypothetical protein